MITLFPPEDDAPGTPVEVGAVRQLRRRGFIETNHKFPTATYLLTDIGERVARRYTPAHGRPLTARRFVSH